jgi:hypothetical protein
MFFDLLATFVQTAGALVNSQAQQTSAKYNQTIDNYNANVTQQEGVIATNAVRQQAIQSIGNNVANAGASGFSSNSGSAVDVIRDAAYNAQMNVLNTQYSYAAKEKSFANQATLQGDRARSASLAGDIGAAGILIGGAGRANKAAYLSSDGGSGYNSSYNLTRTS